MGDTASNDDALKAKEAEIEKLKGELTKAAGRVDNAEKKFAEWGNELGEIRKERESLQNTLADAQKTISELKTVIDGRAKQTPDGVAGHGKEQKADQTPEDIERSLTPEQRKVGETTFAAMTEEERAQYASDLKFKVAFLKRLKNDVPLIPKTPWTTPTEAEPRGKSGVDAILDRVFAKKTKTSFVPEGPDSRIPFLTSQKREKPEFIEDTRVH
jgi:ElaB/YqjD/DUF883 family membrane-anchored ribosome-binding protein